MKPDAKKERDKARLDRKKEGGLCHRRRCRRRRCPAAQGEDVVAGLQALRRSLPRAGALTVDVDTAIERIVRRFALAR